MRLRSSDAGEVHRLYVVVGGEPETYTMVRLLERRVEGEEGYDDDPAICEWLVEDLRDGVEKVVPEGALGFYAFNEMEVLAWASSE